MLDNLALRARRRFHEETAKRMRRRTVRAGTKYPMISFTFDDIPVTAASEGATTLESFGVRGTFYVAGGLCGTDGDDYAHLSAAGCVELHARGHEIACHTFSHCHVADTTPGKLDGEIARNRLFFAQHGGIRLENFSYPFGGVSLLRKRQLEKRFASCRSTMPGINGPVIDLGCLRSVGLWGDMTGERVQDWIDQAVAANGWLIFLAHDLASPHGPWGCAPDLFEEAVERAVASGSEVLPVRDALARLGVVHDQQPPS